MSKTTILRSERGVTLKQVELTSGHTVVATAYVVTSGRTPEEWTFDRKEAAERAYAAEVEKSGG